MPCKDLLLLAIGRGQGKRKYPVVQTLVPHSVMFVSPTTNDDVGGPRVIPPGAEQSGQQTTGVEIGLISVDIFRAHVATMQLEIRLRKRSLHFLLLSQELA